MITKNYYLALHKNKPNGSKWIEANDLLIQCMWTLEEILKLYQKRAINNLEFHHLAAFQLNIIDEILTHDREFQNVKLDTCSILGKIERLIITFYVDKPNKSEKLIALIESILNKYNKDRLNDLSLKNSKADVKLAKNAE